MKVAMRMASTNGFISHKENVWCISCQRNIIVCAKQCAQLKAVIKLGGIHVNTICEIEMNLSFVISDPFSSPAFLGVLMGNNSLTKKPEYAITERNFS